MAYPLSERPERQKPSPASNKPLFTAEREAVEQGVTELLQSKPVQSAIQHPVLKSTFGAISTVMQGASEFADYLKYRATDGTVSPEGLVGTALIGTEALIDKTARGFEMFATGAPIQNPVTGQSLGNVPNLNVDPVVARGVGGLAAETLLGAGVSKFTKGVSNIIPPNATRPALALSPAGGISVQQAPITLADNLGQQAAKPLQIASNLEETGWQGSIRTLLDDKAPPEQIKRLLTKPYHKDLPKKYQYLSMDDFAANKGGWLDTMIEKAEAFKRGMREFRQKKRATTQRRMYDEYTENPLNPDKQLYDPTNPVRKAVTKAFNTVVGKEWHHIFGNKEAAEFMLSRVAQDPYIAVNLIHHLHRIGLPTSGVPQNIALMKKAAHRKTGGYHSWSKALGFENVGRKKGVLEISDYSQEISRGILDGTTEVTELFDILTTYSKVVQQIIKPKIKELGGEVISEMGPVMKYIQGVQKSS